jgi:hypothetical protein
MFGEYDETQMFSRKPPELVQGIEGNGKKRKVLALIKDEHIPPKPTL